MQSSAIRRHSAHLQAEPVIAQHDHRLFAPRALDGPTLILLNLRIDDVAIRDATDEGGNWVYSAAIKRNQAPSSAIQRHQLQSRAINCNHAPSSAINCNHAPSSSVQGRTSSNPYQTISINCNQSPSEDARRAIDLNQAQSIAITHVEQSQEPSGTASTGGTQHFWW